MKVAPVSESGLGSSQVPGKAHLQDGALNSQQGNRSRHLGPGGGGLRTVSPDGVGGLDTEAVAQI